MDRSHYRGNSRTTVWRKKKAKLRKTSHHKCDCELHREGPPVQDQHGDGTKHVASSSSCVQECSSQRTALGGCESCSSSSYSTSEDDDVRESGVEGAGSNHSPHMLGMDFSPKQVKQMTGSESSEDNSCTSLSPSHLRGEIGSPLHIKPHTRESNSDNGDPMDATNDGTRHQLNIPSTVSFGVEALHGIETSPHGSSIEISSGATDDSESDADSLSDMKCLEAHYLEEEPFEEFQGPPQDLAELGEPDSDPDDPIVESDDSSSDESNPEDNQEEPLANFFDNYLNVQPVLRNNIRKGEMILLELAKAVRYNTTFECILDSFRNMNILFGQNCYPASKKKLWKVIQLNKAGIQRHVYCGVKECGQYIGRKERLGEIVQCRCGYRINNSKAKFFVTLDFRNQLKRFINTPGMWEKLQYRQTRVKRSHTAIEDVYDGAEYIRLQQNGGPLSSIYDFSYVFNLDGCQPTKRGSLKMWPIFARLNELPPDMRQKFHFLVALYIDKCDPNFKSFLKPFVKQANYLSTTGITWRPDGINEVTSKFVPLCHCVDAVARHEILNMAKFNSNFGCTYCTHEGIYAGGSRRYPTMHENLDRTHDGMVASMIQAHQNGNAQEGHKGVTQLMLLNNHDLREGQAADDLHHDHEGCAEDITDLLLTVAPRVIPNMDNVHLMDVVDGRLLRIKTPSKIARKPASIKCSASYKGSEWRNWLLFYGVPCLSGLIADNYVEAFSLLSYGCYLLSQDAIQPADTVAAERLLRRFSLFVEEHFGVEKMKFNLHVTTSHKVNSVRKLGPPWCYSTYNFESLNGKFVKCVTSPHGAVQQVVTRYLLHQTVNNAVYNNDVAGVVRNRLQQLLNKDRLHNAHQVRPHVYVVGSAINRVPTVEETALLAREGFHPHNFEEYKSVIVGNTRYKSVAGQNQNSRSDDTFVYTVQDTFCTIRRVVVFRDDNGEEHCGLLVTEHDVVRVLPVARHISVLGDAGADLPHYIDCQTVRGPAIKMNIDGVVYAVCVPNCLEID